MSVEYRYYTIPRPNSFVPTVGQMTVFLEKASAQWKFYPGWIGECLEGLKLKRNGTTVAGAIGSLNDLLNADIRARFPFRWPGRDHAYDLEIHVTPGDYVYHISETVAPFESTSCLKCRCRLDYGQEGDIFQERRIHALCPRCGTVFSPSGLSAIYTHWLTGFKSALPAGAVYRLALIIDNVPEEEWEHFEVDSEFMKLSTKAFGCEFYEIADVV